MEKCFFAHGGQELVIGGKLTFLPGAVVEGCESLFGAVPEDNGYLDFVSVADGVGFVWRN